MRGTVKTSNIQLSTFNFQRGNGGRLNVKRWTLNGERFPNCRSRANRAFSLWRLWADEILSNA